jgi:hypothetical protein
MKRSKILIAGAAVVLSFAGFLVTRANKNFTGLTKFYVKLASGGGTISGVSSSLFTNTNLGAGTVILVTATSKTKIGTAYTTSTSSTKVYYH